MSGNFLALAQPGVQQLSPYVPGKPVDELARELNLDPSKIVKLASNENPLGPSPKVLAAIRETGALEYTAHSARCEADAAMKSIGGLSASPYKNSLLELCLFAVARSF